LAHFSTLAPCLIFPINYSSSENKSFSFQTDIKGGLKLEVGTEVSLFHLAEAGNHWHKQLKGSLKSVLPERIKTSKTKRKNILKGFN
jgi:hypothetical protein